MLWKPETMIHESLEHELKQIQGIFSKMFFLLNNLIKNKTLETVKLKNIIKSNHRN